MADANNNLELNELEQAERELDRKKLSRVPVEAVEGENDYPTIIAAIDCDVCDAELGAACVIRKPAPEGFGYIHKGRDDDYKAMQRVLDGDYSDGPVDAASGEPDPDIVEQALEPKSTVVVPYAEKFITTPEMTVPSVDNTTVTIPELVENHVELGDALPVTAIDAGPVHPATAKVDAEVAKMRVTEVTGFHLPSVTDLLSIHFYDSEADWKILLAIAEVRLDVAYSEFNKNRHRYDSWPPLKQAVEAYNHVITNIKPIEK